VSGIRIAPTLELPIDVAGESTGILAKKGAGKSNTGKVIVEEVLDYGGVQVVVFDPIGHWWSLRAGADGKPKGGYPVVVFGGMHGDLPLEDTAGRLLAQTAVESGQSMVLDVSGLDSNGAMQRFVYEFLEELYKLKQATPTPLLLVLEEADEFAPQDPKGANVPRMIGATNRISKRGRGRGIGMLYFTQRSAALNKNVLDQSDTLIVGRTIGPRDRAAIEGWVKHQQAEGIDEVLPSLPSLATGEVWVWTPERGLLKRVKVRKARTFDSSQTPKPGETAIVANVKPIDVDALGQAIKATVERAKENDPAALRKRLRELETKLATHKGEPERVEIERVVELRVPVFNGEVDRLEHAITALRDVATQLHDAAGAIENAAVNVGTAIATATKETHARPAHTVAARPASTPASRAEPTPRPARAEPRPAPPREERNVRPEGGALGGAAGAMLSALAQFPDGRTRRQLAGLTGYRATGSTMRGALAQLRKLGYCTPAGVEPIRATPEGIAAAGDVETVPTGPALYSYWQAKLGGASRAVLELLYHAGSEGVSREEIAERTGYELGGSTLRGALAELRKFDLATQAGVEPIRASDTLFEEPT
jgi:uncharacterized protein